MGVTAHHSFADPDGTTLILHRKEKPFLVMPVLIYQTAHLGVMASVTACRGNSSPEGKLYLNEREVNSPFLCSGKILKKNMMSHFAMNECHSPSWYCRARRQTEYEKREEDLFRLADSGYIHAKGGRSGNPTPFIDHGRGSYPTVESPKLSLTDPGDSVREAESTTALSLET